MAHLAFRSAEAGAAMLLAALLGWSSSVAAQADFARVQSRGNPDLYLYSNAGEPAAQSTPPGDHSALWHLEQVPSELSVRILNRAEMTYLHTQNSGLELSQVQDDWATAKWLKEPIPGTPFLRFKNSETGFYLLLSGPQGPLAAGDIDQAAPTLAEWRLVGTGETQSAERQPPTAAPQPRLDSAPRIAPPPGDVQAPSDPPIGGVRCPPGTALQRGRCAPVDPGGGRPPATPPSGNSTAANTPNCAAGAVPGPAGKCVPARPPTSECPPGQQNTNGTCVTTTVFECRGGKPSTGADGRRVCVTPGGIVIPATVICAKGQVADGRGVCVADPVLECPVNTSRMGTKCIPIGGGKPIDATTRCQGGMVLNSGGICEAPVPELANLRRQQALATPKAGQPNAGQMGQQKTGAAQTKLPKPQQVPPKLDKTKHVPGGARPNAQEKVKKITTGCTPLRKKLRRC
jgi:hypothetical protein